MNDYIPPCFTEEGKPDVFVYRDQTICRYYQKECIHRHTLEEMVEVKGPIKTEVKAVVTAYCQYHRLK